MELFNLPVSLLRQYHFCSRIPYFMLVKELSVKGGPWLKQGLSFHEKTAMLTKCRNLAHYGLPVGDFRFVADIKLYDEALGLHGICDGAVFAENGAVFPLEFKMTETPPAIGAKVQLAAYAMLLEKREETQVSRGFVLMGKRGKTYEVLVDAKMRQEVIRVSVAIRKSLERALLPDTSATAPQCCQCEYANFCADRL